MDELAFGNQHLAVSEPEIEFVSGGEFAWVGGRMEGSKEGTFVTWWVAPREVAVEDVVAFARSELKRAFDYEPVHFIQCDFCRYGEYPFGYVDGSGLVLWTFVHAPPLTPPQMITFGEGNQEEEVLYVDAK